MTNSKISKTFRLKSLSALIGVALASGMYARPANAGCDSEIHDTCVVNTGDTLEEPVSEMPSAITNNGTVIFNQDTEATYSGQISGSGLVVQKGSGHIDLVNDGNTYSGGTTIQGGSLGISHDGSLGDVSGNVTLDGGTLGLNANLTSDRDFNITAADGTIMVGSAITGTLNGVISGEGELIVSGDSDGDLSAVILNGNNTYQGGTTIQNGASLAISDDQQLGAKTGNVTINNAGLSLNGDVTSDRSITLAGNNGTLSTAVGTTSTLNGKITGTAGLLVQGSGTVILTNSNDYQGGTTITYGATVSIGNDEALGDEAGSITLEGGILDLTSDVTSGRAINIIGGTTGTIATGSGTTSTLTGNITDNGGGAFIATGDGTLVLTGDSTYTGGTTIAGSTLQLGDGGTTGSITGDVVNGGTFAFNRSDTVTFGGDIHGTGAVVQKGSGTLILTGDNDYQGGTTIQGGGTLSISGDGALGASTGGVTLDGGKLALTDSLTSGRLFNITDNNGEIETGSDTTSTLTGKISGDGKLTTSGDGTLVLASDNNYQGGTTITSGILQLGNGGTTGSIQGDVSNNGTLMVNRSDAVGLSGVISGSGTLTQQGTGTTVLMGNNTYTGQTTITQGTLQLGNGGTTGSIAGDVTNNGILAFNRSDTVTFNGTISGDGSVVQGGSGTTILSAANTYAGGTTIQAGTLSISDDSALGDADGQLTLAGGTLALTNNVVSGRAIEITSASGAINTQDGTTSTLGGPLTGEGGLISNGSGTLVLTGENTYAGGTRIASGTLQIGDGGTTGSIQGDVRNDGTLVFNRSDDTTFGGTISGSGSLVQSGGGPDDDGDGVGTTILLGNNTYTGGTTIERGTLQLGNGGTTGSIVGNVTNNSELVFNRSDAMALDGVISGSGSVEQAGTGTTVLTGNNTYTGSTTITQGTLQLGNGGTTGSIAGDVANNGTLAFNRTDTVTFDGIISGDGSVVQRGSGTTVLSAPNTYTGGTTIQAGTLSISDDNALGSADGQLTLAGGTLALTNSVTSGRAIEITSASGAVTAQEGTTSTLGGPITGDGGLISNGPGTLVLTAANTYAGGTLIANGTLQIGNGGTTGSIQGDVHNNGTLVFKRSGDATFGGAISGSGSLVQSGTDPDADGDGVGTTILLGNNTYTGGTTIERGTLQLGNGGTTGSIVGNVKNSGTLAFNRSDAVVFSGVISGSGSVEQAGTGTTVLTGNSTYTGSTSITHGTLQLGNGGTTGSIAGDVTNNGTLAFNRSDTVSFQGAISGSGSVLQQGRGTTILNADNPYQGRTTINAGTLIVGDRAQTSAALSGGGGVQINAAGTLGGYGHVTGAVTNLGTIAVANATSALTGNGNLTIAGDLNNSGRIRIGGSGVGNSLTVTGNYAGNNGVIAMNAYLHADDSTSDQLIIQTGSASGATRLNINNTGGLGGYTTGNGIRVVLAQNGGQTSAGNFSLGTPVVAGPYEYTLYRGSVDQSSPDSWYLRSTRPNNPDHPSGSGGSASVPNYRPEVSLYGSLAPTALEYGRSLIDSLHERVGEHAPWQAQNGDALSMSRDRVWGRYLGSSGTRAGSDNGIYGDYGPRYDYEFNGMQIGADLWRHQGENGHHDMAGLTAAVGDASTTVEHHDGQRAGKGQIKGYSLGAYWTHYGPRDWYIDTGLMFTKYRLSGNSHRGLPEMSTDGWGMSANVEAGYPFQLNDEWRLEPQAQLTYQWIDIDTTHDSGATIRFNDVQSLVGRLGVRLARNWTLDSGPSPRYFSVWGRLSVLREALGTPRTEFSSSAGYIPFHSDIRSSWTQILLGVTGAASDNLTLYASGGYQETFTGGDASGWNGKVGLRWQW